MPGGQKRRWYRHRVAHTIGISLLAALLMAQTGRGQQPRQSSKSSADQEGTATHEPAAKSDSRRARRSARRSADKSALTQPRKKRASRNGRGGADRRAQKRLAAGNDAASLVHLNGSFQVNLGHGLGVHGEGSTTVHLDPATHARLRKVIANNSTPAAKEMLQIVARLPETLQSTSEILKILSDPDTQENLRQVEQVLRLLQYSPGNLNAGK
jgi:hypothetical protein